MKSQKIEEQRKKKQHQGNVISCLDLALHHLERSSWGDKTWLMMQRAKDPQAVIEYRHRIISEEISEVLARIKKIKEIATQPEVLAILNEEFEFGHDL